MATMADAGVKPIVRRRYSHLSGIDSGVWSALLEERGRRFERVWYDVWCGDGEGVDTPSGGAGRRLSDGIYCKRIDVVTLCQGLYIIWEVKPWGNCIALGQVLMYGELFRRRYQDCRPIQLAIVCASQDPDCVRIMDAQKGWCHKVGLRSIGL